MANKWGNDEWAAFSFVAFVAVVHGVVGVLIYLVASLLFGTITSIIIAIVSVCGWVIYHEAKWDEELRKSLRRNK